MIELTEDEFPIVKHFLGDFPHCIPLNAVLDGRHTGRVFVDNATTPSVGYVWTSWGYHYLIGDPQHTTFIPALREKLVDELQPQSAALGEPDILLTLIPDAWEPVLGDLLPAPAVIKLYRSTFTFNRNKFLTLPGWQNNLPSGLTMARIDENLASRITDDICATWRNEEEFLTEGFGYCLLAGSEIVSVCLSAFVARGQVEIGVSTEKAYHRRGYGSLTAAAMIKHCLENGLSPHWECFWDNESSIGLARKLGFAKKNDVPIYYWQRPPTA